MRSFLHSDHHYLYRRSELCCVGLLDPSFNCIALSSVVQSYNDASDDSFLRICIMLSRVTQFAGGLSSLMNMLMLFMFSTMPTPELILRCYGVVFGVLIVLVELELPFVLSHAAFMDSRVARGLCIAFVVRFSMLMCLFFSEPMECLFTNIFFFFPHTCHSAGLTGRFVRPPRCPKFQLLAAPRGLPRDCRGLGLHRHGPLVLPAIEASRSHQGEEAPGLPGRGAAVHCAQNGNRAPPSRHRSQVAITLKSIVCANRLSCSDIFFIRNTP